MEFNPDGSLKIGGSTQKKDEVKAKFTVRKISSPKKGTEVVIELFDEKLPYNLIESTFQQINNNFDIDCDAHLGKRSETNYDVSITGTDQQKWVDHFVAQLKDFMDNAITIEEV